MEFKEKLMQKAPEILASRTLEQTLCKTIENPETLINTGFKLGNTWQQIFLSVWKRLSFGFVGEKKLNMEQMCRRKENG